MENKKLELIDNIIDRLGRLDENDTKYPIKYTFISEVSHTILDTIRYSKELKEILLEEDTYKNASENIGV